MGTDCTIRRLKGRQHFLSALVVAYCICAAVTAGAANVCTGCHGALVRGDFLHDPVASGNCNACHIQQPAVDHPKIKKAFRLLDQNEKLCLKCHESKASKQFAHKPVADGRCLACHNPHRSEFKGLTKTAVKALCLQCHEDKFSWPVPHKPVADGNCLACHDPHQSENHMLLRKPETSLCFNCHDASMARGRSVHQPVDGGDCGACHEVHGSKQNKLLSKAYPSEMYQSFAVEKYALCFDCHESSLATEAITASDTNFRNGDQNLHFVHLMVTGRGRSCRTCHEVHAAHQEHLVRDALPGFGNWQVPVNYTENERGGTCVAGCHKPKSYDRVHTFSNP